MLLCNNLVPRASGYRHGMLRKLLKPRWYELGFRQQLVIGVALLAIIYGSIVALVGTFFLQPSLLQQTLDNGRGRSANFARHLAPLLTAAAFEQEQQLSQALEGLLQTNDVRHCVVYSPQLQPLFEKGIAEVADAELKSLLTNLGNNHQPLDQVVCREGNQHAFITINPLLFEAHAEDTQVARVSQLNMKKLTAPLVGFLRVDYDLAFLRQKRHEFMQLNLLTTMLLLGAGIGLALLWSRGLHRPLQQLLDGAQRIGNGDLEHRIEIQGHNELVLLGKSFNRMAAHLQQRAGQLLRSETLYRHLVQDALDGIFVVDQELRFIEVNEKFCEMFGCTREELLQSTLNEVIAKTTGAEEDLSEILSRRPFRGELAIQPRTELALASSLYNGRLASFIEKSGNTGEAANAEKFEGYKTRTPQTTAWRNLLFARTIDLNAAPINDEVYMGIARDITEKKHYEVELHRAAELRELLLRTMSDGIAVLDRAGDLLISNRALEEIFAMSQAEFLQSRFFEFKNGWQVRTLKNEHLPRTHNPIYLALHAQKRSSDCRLKISRAGEEKYLSVNAAPLYDEREQLIGAIVAVRDMTATVQNERAREILQQQMQQTARLAALGELAAGVAHEINNPMTGIINYAQLLYERAPLNDEKQFLLQGILRESDRVTKIVHNLLTFARQQPQEQSWVALAELLESALHLMGHRLRKDGINVICEIPADLSPLQCRSQQIQQVFINLVSNAQHALNQKHVGAHDGKTLKISAQAVQRQDRHFIRIEFHDTGVGIAPQVLPKIFDPFFTTKKRAEGTGLGLSISYGIVKEHHGDIFVESRAGEYTTFTIELPVTNDALPG